MAQVDDTKPSPVLGRRYQVADSELWLHREGTGTPTVVYLPGAGLAGPDYLNLHNRTAELATSVLYDRSGTGWSSRDRWPRTSTQAAAELAELLTAAAVPGPYVLVGHSLGGAYARRFAQLQPALVAGMVLLEPLHEDWDTFMPEPVRLAGQPPAEQSMPPVTDELVAHFRAVFIRTYAEWPDGLRELLVERRIDPALLLRGLQENRTAQTVCEELRQGGPVPDVPLIVLSALGIDPGQALFLSPADLAAQNEAKLRLNTSIAASMPRGEHRVLDSGTHSSIHMDRPDDVLRAIKDVIDHAAGHGDRM